MPGKVTGDGDDNISPFTLTSYMGDERYVRMPPHFGVGEYRTAWNAHAV